MRVLLCLVLLLWPAAAGAAVRIDFYSRHQARHFPHAYVALSGTLEATGEAVDANFGFTPRFVSPAVLVGPIGGRVASADAAYVAGGVRHFSLTLSDDEYRRAMAVVEDWRTRPQPSYRLDGANCVSFVAAIALALGLDATPEPATARKPRAFLDGVRRRNADLIAARSASPALAAAPDTTAGRAPASR